MESLGGANGGLYAAALYARCDPATFGFETTAELEDLVGDAVGQSRVGEVGSSSKGAPTRVSLSGG